MTAFTIKSEKLKFSRSPALPKVLESSSNNHLHMSDHPHNKVDMHHTVNKKGFKKIMKRLFI